MAAPPLGPFTTAVRQVLDQPMVDRGFQAGQGGDVPPPPSVLFCAPVSTVHDRWPELVESLTRARGIDLLAVGTCLDLTVEGTIGGGISIARFEGVPISELSGTGSVGASPARGAFDAQLAGVLAWVVSAMPLG